MREIIFFDLEVDNRAQIKDIGAWHNGAHFHDHSIRKFNDFLSIISVGAEYICGHNIFNHDIPILKENHIDDSFINKHAIDTLYLSTLLFPERPYHKLVKDYKLISEEPNNPVSDSKLTMRLLNDCVAQFNRLEPFSKRIFFHILKDLPQFLGFFSYLKKTDVLDGIIDEDIHSLIEGIKKRFAGKLCSGFNFEFLIQNRPLEFAYSLALVNSAGMDSVFPPWLVHQHPGVLQTLHQLRFNRCNDIDCAYCHTKLDTLSALKSVFGFDSFRRFDDEPGYDKSLQEKAIDAALDNRSFLAVFPTGGGKSLTFQLPALMKGDACRSLAVVISPLQSLMKDQVDILKLRHERTDAVAINGLLSPLERAEAIEKVESGEAHILYISPESLRSNTILRLVKSRFIDRFVIDEAHCFSAWGQDFRVDYQYIVEFIKLVMVEKCLSAPIPVSCFTATAKPQVIDDIKNYFLEKLGITLDIFKTVPKRKNLSYGVYYAASPQEKFTLLRNLLSQDDKPKIVYTNRVKQSEILAEKLKGNGFITEAYNGQMDSERKIKIQDNFMSGKIDVIVATSAFGMGIDKDDVSMVIHYNISDSLENYIQEAGRAGRNKDIKADCFVLFDDSDLMGHFTLLNATRINKKEIYQVWQGIKKIRQEKFSRSALELARIAGWDSELTGWENRVKTSLAALEECGLIKRGQNQTQILASGLLVKNMAQASEIINRYDIFDDNDRVHATRIIKHIISYKSCGVDSISDILGITKQDTRRLIDELKGIGIIGDDRDLSAYVDINPASPSDSMNVFQKFSHLETTFIDFIRGDENVPVKKISLKDINHNFRDSNIDCDIESLRAILFSWQGRKWIIKKRLDRQNHLYQVQFMKSPSEVKERIVERLETALHILEKLRMDAGGKNRSSDPGKLFVEFSITELKKYAEKNLFLHKNVSVTDYDKALLYLNEISSIKLDRGLFVYYSPYSITRSNMDNKRMYTNEDFRKFETFYRNKIEQIHIVGEYAKKLSKNYREAMTFVDDYFSLEYPDFIKKYFPRRISQIQKPITETQFKAIFKDLSPDQLTVINDNQSKAILVAAGPGSGKTRVLVHKVASLLTLEDIKAEQFLMLTYSRAACLEMKERLKGLINDAARYIDIYTFHSYAFSIAEIKGDLEQAGSIIPRAVEMIVSGKASNKVESKSVLVIDEFQDIAADEFALIKAIADTAKEIRVLVVGDDDQNIFEFRGSSTLYMRTFKDTFDAKIYHLSTNYRSLDNLVRFSNTFIKKLPERIKGDQDLVSASPKKNGKISIIKYTSSSLITPFVNDIAAKRISPGSQTAAVLTATNDEALQVYSLLRQKGIKAKLLASFQDFSVKFLVELNMFSYLISQILKNCGSPIIEREKWGQAKNQTRELFSRSKQLDLALMAIESFEKEHEILVEIDWWEYLDEIKLEDLVFPDEDTVFVSTMHKAKGKEFDHVFVLLDNFKIVKDENLRVIYVAITRAKRSLSIHTTHDIFDDILVPDQARFYDNNRYSDPDQITLQLTHRDVHLDFFTSEPVQEALKNLQAGAILGFSEQFPDIITASGKKILRFSEAAGEKLRKFFDKGYRMTEIIAEYIVIWRKKDNEKYYRIILPRLKLTK